ncbi:MAG TPA: VOC family protein [Gaiellaceae bacterium]|nr:VOC family protein [Gaiellaceae bacterium]
MFDENRERRAAMPEADALQRRELVRASRDQKNRSESYEGWPKTPGFFRLHVEDADASYQQAMRAGAISVTEVTELFWGDRIGRVRDPFGNIWWLQSHATGVPYDQMETRIDDPGMFEAMRYVQQTLVDELREQGERHD